MTAGHSRRAPRVSCDSVVALAALTARATTFFAKNSDRPADEPQPLVQVAAADHPSGSRLACQYVDIEQARHTHAFVGSRPYWLWGCEHGVNERGLVVGNHTIFTKDPVAASGLLGMDLVRLALERAASAAEAVEVITALIEEHGQGGSGYADTSWPYHNSFLVADAAEAFLIEASARHWALKRLVAGGNATNHTTIGKDWDQLSPQCEAHARAMGWWQGNTRFDFAQAYRDTSVVPPVISSARYRATSAALRAEAPAFDLERMQRLMRDHNVSGDVYTPGFPPDDERAFSVCMHADPVGTTTASMIVELAADARGLRIAWVAFCNPCIAPYLPMFLDAELPAALTTGAAEPDETSAWWQFKRLLGEVERDWPRHGPLVRNVWREYEEELRRRLAAVSVDAAEQAAFMDEVWRETKERIADLRARLR